MDKFSIITVCYNAKDSIIQTIESVLSQNYESVEYIIIDGYSTDGTIDVIKQYQDKIEKIISEPDQGIYDAMNKGSRIATGDWILFMNAGDSFVNQNVLTEISSRILPDSDVIYGDNVMVYNSTRKYHRAHFFSTNDINMPFNHQSALVKAIYAKQYPFNLKYKIAGDYNFFFNLYKSGKKFQYLSLPIANYSMDGFSQQNVIQTFKEVSNIRQREKKIGYYFMLSYLKLKLILGKVLPNNLIRIYHSVLR